MTQRVSAIVYPIIAINAGDVATDSSITQSIQALYATGNFSDVKDLHK